MTSKKLFSLGGDLSNALTNLAMIDGGLRRGIEGIEEYYYGKKASDLTDEMLTKVNKISGIVDRLNFVVTAINAKAAAKLAEEKAAEAAAKLIDEIIN